MGNYWKERYEKLPNYIVVSRDGDGIMGHYVIHKKDENEFNSTCYHSSIIIAMDMNKSKMQELANHLNNE